MNSVKATTSDFENIKINIKIKLSALWASLTLCYLYGDYFELYVPQKTAGLVNGINGLDSPMKLFTAAILMVIPSLMVGLSIILKPNISRRLNIIFGMFFTVIMVLIALTSLTPWRTFYVFLAIVECGISLLIVYNAWKWPKNTLQ